MTAPTITDATDRDSLPALEAASETGTNGTAGARRIAAAFARAREEGRAALVPYVVAGYPDADTSFEIALAAADAGADVLEVGLPYSDPLADGATLQRASGAALASGATLERSLRLIERIGAARPELPVVPMGYANQVIGGGDGERVARRLSSAGAAGLIVADLTPDEGASFEDVAREAGLAVVYLVAPTTPPERRAAVAARSGGFLYCVSLVGVTGARTSLPSSVGRLVRDVKAVSPVPVGVGFGVSRPAHVRAIVKAGADGVIVASALVDALGPDGRDVAGANEAGPRPACRDPARRQLRARRGQDRRHRGLDRGSAEEGVRHSRRLARLVTLRKDRRGGDRRAAPRLPTGTASSRARLACGFRPRPMTATCTTSSNGRGGASGTEFGVPSAITDLDRKPVDKADARRLVRILEAAWTVFDRVAASAPAELRKGPRGGGRDRDKMIGHVIESEWYYSREIGLREPQPDPADRAAVEALRAAMLDDPAPTVGRLAAGRAQVAAPLRDTPNRMARPRSRLGDGGPDRARVAGPGVTRGTPRSARPSPWVHLHRGSCRATSPR